MTTLISSTLFRTRKTSPTFTTSFFFFFSAFSVIFPQASLPSLLPWGNRKQSKPVEMKSLPFFIKRNFSVTSAKQIFDDGVWYVNKATVQRTLSLKPLLLTQMSMPMQTVKQRQNNDASGLNHLDKTKQNARLMLHSYSQIIFILTCKRPSSGSIYKNFWEWL